MRCKEVMIKGIAIFGRKEGCQMTKSISPDEYSITLYLNKQEIATYQLTNQNLDEWAIGYLYSEGMINSVEDLERIKVLFDEGIVCIKIKEELDNETFKGRKKHYTAGCGRGLTFLSMTDVGEFPKVESSQLVSTSYLLEKRVEFAKKSPMYISTGGMHGACIVEPDGKITVREDIGRHNAVDKIIGYSLKKGLQPKDLILITTGRISYEMLSKVARFGVGIIGSRTAATTQAIELAKSLNIEVVGYLRGKMATIYTDIGYVYDDLKDKVSVI